MLLHLMLQAAAGTANVTPKVINISSGPYSLGAMSWDGDETWPAINTSLTVDDVEITPAEDKIFYINRPTGKIYTYELKKPGYFGNVALRSHVMNVYSTDSQTYGFCFGNSGTRLYTVGSLYDKIYQFNLTTAYDTSTASLSKVYDPVDNNLRARNPTKIQFSPNGRKMWVFFTSVYALWSRTQAILQYNLSTPWEIDSATWEGLNHFPRTNLYMISNNSKIGGTGQFQYPLDLSVMPNQTRFYTLNRVSYRPVVAIDIDAAGQMATARQVGQLNTSSVDNNCVNMFVNNDQTRVYVLGRQNQRIYQFNLSAAGNLGSGYYTGISLYIGTNSTFGESFPCGLAFSVDGSRMYFSGETTRRIWEYNLTTPWELSTARFAGAEGWYKTYIGGYERDPRGLRFGDNGNKFYIIGADARNYGGITGASITEFTCETPYTLFNAQVTGRFNLRSQTTTPHSLYFRPDGYQCWVGGSTYPPKIHVYNLGTAWDIDTASHAFTWTVPPGQNQNPGGCGPYNTVRVYATASGSSSVWGSNPYLSDSHMGRAAVHAGIASPGQYVYIKKSNPGKYSGYVGSNQNGVISKSYSGQYCGFYIEAADGPFTYSRETYQRGIWFSPYGHRFYIVGADYSRIHQYDLYSPWDLNTASLSKFGVTTTTAEDLWFSDDGARFYTTRSGYLYVHELGTPWEVDTITSKWNKNFRILSNADISSAIYGIDFSGDGQYFFSVGSNLNVVRIPMSTNWNLNTLYLPTTGAQGSYNMTPNFAKTIRFSSDGRNMYAGGGQWYSSYANDPYRSALMRYSLSQEWNINTASPVNSVLPSQFNTTTPINYGVGSSVFSGMDISSDGTVFYIANYDPGLITRIPLSQPMNVTSLKSPNPAGGQGYYVPPPTSWTQDFFWKSDYTRFYTLDGYEQSGSTSYAGKVYSYTASNYQQMHTAPTGTATKKYDYITYSMAASQSGTRLYAGTNTRMMRYAMSTPWDTNTGALEGTVATNMSYVQRGRGFYYLSTNGKAKVGPDGRSFFIVNGRTIYRVQFNNAWDFSAVPGTTQTNLPSFPYGYNTGGFCFSYDGADLFILRSGNYIYHYRMSVPWTLTPVFVRYKSIPGVTAFESISIRPDGASLFLVQNYRIREYAMSIPYNIGTMSYVKELVMDSDKGGNRPVDHVWSIDGSKLLVLSAYPTSVSTDPGPMAHEYYCAVPFDLSTTTFVRSMDLYNRAHNFRDLSGIDVDSEGKRMLIVQRNYIFSYTLIKS